ncbi:MAG: hypothetical protein FD177_665 [Desulfovibrionaceae bacterium]|nr:MAG: hypothetical protein FD177_665 [Desulfovibrionaceae bacterium]
MTQSPEATIIACGIFRKELAALGYSHKGAEKLVCLNSMLHMRPSLLDELLDGMLRGKAQRHLLVYGDCCPHMDQFARMDGVRRVAGVNCCEIILGHDRYRELRRAGVFFFMPEWTRRWERVFKKELGFTTQETAQEFMREMHTRLIYLDTGVGEVPRDTLADIETYLGMPVEVFPVGLGQLEAALLAGLQSLNAAGDA